MRPMPLTDAVFLAGESPENPMHVGGLQIFRLPPGAGADHLRQLYRDGLAAPAVNAPFRCRPERVLGALGQWGWRPDGLVDLEYHFRHSALPRPGRVRELLELTSRLHGTLLDRARPLWECHLIEGLERRRFAVYTKLHHSLFDGVSALRLLERCLSPDADARDFVPPWALVSAGPRPRPAPNPREVLAGLARSVGEVAAMAPTVGRTINRALHDQAAALPFRAPRTMFNVTITGARRFAGESWPLERLRGIARASATTVNDVVLAACAGALRAYLLEARALPDSPLVAMVPVSLRAGRAESEFGNALGSVLCNLATDLAEPGARLALVHESMRQGKAALAGLSPLQVTLLSAVPIVPLALNTTVRLHQLARPVFNLVISNVPGPRNTLHWNGARLDGVYPLSIPLHGQALNITATSYADAMHVGLTGCRRSVPHLQRLLSHLDTAIGDLERAAA